MGSGEQATLNLTGDNFLQVAVPTNTKTADGKALVDVSGKVRAAGGSVVLKAATVAQAIRNAVNVPGDLSVASARASGGSIILSGGPGGEVSVTGRLKASGRSMGRRHRDQRPRRRHTPGEVSGEQRQGPRRVGRRDRNDRGQSRVDRGRRLGRDGRRRELGSAAISTARATSHRLRRRRSIPLRRSTLARPIRATEGRSPFGRTR